jgi:hypothetical protein
MKRLVTEPHTLPLPLGEGRVRVPVSPDWERGRG